MRDELYINNQRVDMSESGINLTFRSNLLSDISKIVSNYSYTIKLPKTANNLRITSGAVFPSSESSFPYLVHAGRVLRDGIVIIDNANVILFIYWREYRNHLIMGRIVKSSRACLR